MGYYLKGSRKQRILGNKSFKNIRGGNHFKNIADVFSSNSLEDKRCFLLGGGPSLKKFDYSRLKDEFTIGINKTFTVFSPTINYLMDVKFYDYLTKPGVSPEQKDIQAAWKNYNGYKVLLYPRRRLSTREDEYTINRIGEKVLSFDIRKGIYAGNNSGFGALMMAIAMGCKSIALLGYDMKITSNKQTHWHKGYPRQKVKDLVRKLGMFKELFEEFSPSIEKEGVKIVNLNLGSALECFPKKNFREV